MRKMCRSCGMPLKKDEDKGTEINGGVSEKYCTHCYQKGKFTWPDATVEQMQTYCMGVLTKDKHMPSFLARAMTNGIPKLERWH